MSLIGEENVDIPLIVEEEQNSHHIQPVPQKYWILSEDTTHVIAAAKMHAHHTTIEELYSVPKPITRSFVSPSKVASPEELAQIRGSGKQLPWRALVDNGKEVARKELVGVKQTIDPFCHFMAIDKGSHVEVIPVEEWVLWNPEVITQTSNINADVAERIKLAAAEAEDRRIQKTLSMYEKKKASLDSDEEMQANVPASQKKVKSEFDSSGLRTEKEQKMRQIMLRRIEEKQVKTAKDELNYSSASTLGHIKTAEVDWDWDDHGKATDDEDVAGQSDDQQQVDEEKLSSSDESGDLFTQYGQKMNQLVKYQKEREADDELAEFSDMDDDDDEAFGDESPEASSRSSAPKTEKTKTSAEVKKVPKSQTEFGVGGDYKSKVMGVLQRHGGRVTTKYFMETFKLNNRKSEHFEGFKKALSELCEIHSEKVDGEEQKVIELRPEFKR
eukprot:GHVP01051379.1.p1 GENE.GHVP01051379.1~~GHVP01051379.1.p1  ORF type:complete len:459 (+),score=115.26 GHVP01051379.1:49-1377(+)